MIASIILNYLFALLIFYSHNKSKSHARIVLGLGITINLLLLVGFKYLDFLFSNIGLPPKHIRLPLGISFFTFHAISYIVDVYFKKAKPMKNIVDTALYISFFPQLIAGPIVRYHDIAAQIVKRAITANDFVYGIQRFIQGLGKKVLIANVLAVTADRLFDKPVNELTFGTAWLAIICYSLQLYFDFSGYSDMAIGLARMFGFTFPENFNYPYISQSITEFWRRWHISLSQWFRDYLYIPLGGSRKGLVRTCLNLLIVFALCGLWHGANWTFILWGLYYGLILVIEKLGLLRILEALPRFIRHIYALVIIIIGWVLFRSYDLAHALSYIAKMVNIKSASTILLDIEPYVNNHMLLVLIAAVLYSMPAVKQKKFSIFSYALLFIFFVASIMSIAANTYNPFIYFRF
jgi:alginate O-acetyltransferase complex protein AlgI